MSNLGTLIIPEFQGLDDNGNPLNGGKLYSYAAGTTTPQNTYSDAGLTTPNANPVILNAAGRALVYLDNTLAYKFILQTSAGVQVGDTVDPFYPPGYVAMQAVQSYIPQACQGRLTLTSGNPVTTTDVTAATTVYFTPYKGNVIGLYNGTSWQLVTFTEKSLSISGFAASTPFDVWGRLSSGALAIDSTAWSSDTSRATALTTQDGVYVKSGDTTRRYLGTFRTTTVVGQTEDSFAKRYCWNYYHRVQRPMRVTDSTASWTYTTATFRQANNNTANQLDFVIGVAEVAVDATVLAQAANTNTGVNMIIGIGLNGITLAANTQGQFGQSAVANSNVPMTSRLRVFPAAGRNYMPWLEQSVATGTTTWIGGNTNSPSGISGSVEG